jgi:hypothetical protein
VRQAAHYRFIPINITIPDFQVKTAIRVGANPCFVMYGRALAAEIGQRHEVTCIAFLALGESVIIHGSASQPEILIKRS